MLHKRIIQPLAAALFLALVLVACAPLTAQEQEPTDTPPAEEGLAPVENIQLQIMESFPIQVSVLVEGYLPDGCTEVDQINESFDEETNTFNVEITTIRPAGAVCTQQIVPLEEIVPLDVRGLPAGTYTVNVNGVTDTFTFDVDNEIPQEEPGDASQIEWEEARDLILSGEVEAVTQLHSLEVRLQLQDGRELVTIEPHIDDVFDVIDQCGEPCEDIIVATE